MGFVPESFRRPRSKCSSSLVVGGCATALFAFATPTHAQTYSFSYPSYYAGYYAGAAYGYLPTYQTAGPYHYNPNLYYYRSYYPYPLPYSYRRRCDRRC
jgi:hypothetical protein